MINEYSFEVQIDIWKPNTHFDFREVDHNIPA